MLLLISFKLSAQYDANWAFGNQTGFSFHNGEYEELHTNMYTQICKNDTLIKFSPLGSSTISDCSGKLKLYTDGCYFYDSSHTKLKMTNPFCEESQNYRCNGGKYLFLRSDIYNGPEFYPLNAEATKIVMLGKNLMSNFIHVLYIVQDSVTNSWRIDTSFQAPSDSVHSFDVITITPFKYRIVGITHLGEIVSYYFDADTFRSDLKKNYTIFSTTSRRYRPQVLVANPKGDVLYISRYPHVYPALGYSVFSAPYDPVSGTLTSPPAPLYKQTQVKSPSFYQIGRFLVTPSGNFAYAIINVVDTSISKKRYTLALDHINLRDSTYSTAFTNIVSDTFLSLNDIAFSPLGDLIMSYGGKNNLDVVYNADNPIDKITYVEDAIVYPDTVYPYGLVSAPYSPPYRFHFSSLSDLCTDSLYLQNNSDTPYFSNFTWFFGDGDSATDYHATHTYKAGGNYKVSLRGENECGGFHWYHDSIEVRPRVHLALEQKSALSYSCGSAALTFQALDTASVADSLWWTTTYIPDTLLGDSFALPSLYALWQSGSSDSTFILNRSGRWAVGVAASSQWCSDTAWDTVRVVLDDTPSVVLTLVNDKFQCSPATYKVGMVASSRAKELRLLVYKAGDSMVGSEWDKLTSDTIEVVLEDTGSYMLGIEVRTPQGCTAIDTIKQLRVLPQPQALFTLQPQDTSCSTRSYKVLDNSLNTDARVWIVDGDTLSALGDSLLQLPTGSHSISLFATNTLGCSSRSDTILEVLPAPLPQPFIITAPDSQNGCAPFPLSLTVQRGLEDSLLYRLTIEGDLTQLWKPYAKLLLEVDTLLLQPENYVLELRSINRYGCVRDSLISIKVYQPAEATLQLVDSQLSCGEYNYQLSYSTLAGSPLFLLDADTLQPTAEGWIAINDSLPHQLRLVALSPHGCHDTALLHLQAHIPPAPSLSFTLLSDTPACLPYLFRGSIDTFPPGSTSWQFEADGEKWGYSGPNPLIVGLPEATDYFIHLIHIDDNGCYHYSDTMKISVLPHTQAQATASPSSGCSPLFVTLSRSQGNGSYFWTSGTDTFSGEELQFTQRLESSEDTVFKYILHSTTGSCTDTSSVSISVRSLQEREQALPLYATVVQPHPEAKAQVLTRWSLPVDAERLILQRSYDQQGWVDVVDLLVNNPVWEYIDDQAFIQPKAPYYRLIMSDNCGNSSISSFLQPIYLYGSDTLQGSSASLRWNAYLGRSGGISLTYSALRADKAGLPLGWSTLGTTSNLSYLDEDFFTTETQERCYRIISSQGEDTTRSNIQCLPLRPFLYIPDVFTPTFDALNDGWGVVASNVQQMRLQVYSRWGELLWDASTPDARWNGKYKGKPVPDGGYLYSLRLQHGSGDWIEKKGVVKVLR